MPWKGELQRDVPFTIDIAGDISDKTAITIVKINQRGGTHSRIVTVPLGQPTSLDELLGPRIVRMILRVHLPDGGHTSLRVLQGAFQFTHTFEGDADLVWDAVA
jgi:hypothetical protein